EREKKNIVNLDSTWDCLKHWELKKFHYNEDADADDLRYGVIAQQVADYCPEVISEWVKQKAEPSKLDDEGNEIEPAKEEVVRMAVKEQQMMWMAIKALQEAQLRIETLEAEVAALKGA
ncbi:MAG: Synechococcus phage, partial [Pseudomonadota bacterium]